MATLLEAYNANKDRYSLTDKNTWHCYIDCIYDSKFSPRKDSTSKVLEIGMDSGDSLRLWRDYFENANIFGIDIKDAYRTFTVEDSNRITRIVGDAYSKPVIDLISNDFDIIIDDGPHTLQSMMVFAQHYSTKLAKDGIAIIEDIPKLDWITTIAGAIPRNQNLVWQAYDLRTVRPKEDDIVLIIQKT